VVAAGSILLVVHDDGGRSLPGAASPNELRSRVVDTLGRAGHPVADAEIIWNELVRGDAPLNAGRIDTPIPSVWPRELRADWEQGRALCLAKAGPPPYGVANLPAYLCGLKIAPVLWQRWLDHVQAEQVVVVEVHRTNPNDARHDGWNVEVSAYEPGSIDDHRLFRGEIPPAAVAEAAGDLAARAFGGEGRIIRRTLEREMPDSPRYHALPAAALPNDGVPVRPRSARGTPPPPRP
jgi:hypothetical protein